MYEQQKDAPRIITVIAVKEMLPEAVVAMTKHGCNITFHDTCCEVQFPAGTVQIGRAHV